MRYLTFRADFIEPGFLDDFRGPIVPEQEGLPSTLCDQIEDWNNRYQAILPLDPQQRAEESVAQLVESLDQEGLSLALTIAEVLGDVRVRYFSEGLGYTATVVVKSNAPSRESLRAEYGEILRVVSSRRAQTIWSREVGMSPVTLIFEMFVEEFYNPKSDAFIGAFADQELRDIAGLYGRLDRVPPDDARMLAKKLHKQPEWREVVDYAKQLLSSYRQ